MVPAVSAVSALSEKDACVLQGKDECFDERWPAGVGGPYPPEKDFQESVFSIWEALEKERRIIPLEESEGSVCAEYVWCYPPGVPLLLPGERVTVPVIKKLRSLEDSGTCIHYSLSGGNAFGIACLI